MNHHAFYDPKAGKQVNRKFHKQLKPMVNARALESGDYFIRVSEQVGYHSDYTIYQVIEMRRNLSVNTQTGLITFPADLNGKPTHCKTAVNIRTGRTYSLTHEWTKTGLIKVIPTYTVPLYDQHTRGMKKIDTLLFVPDRKWFGKIKQLNGFHNYYRPGAIPYWNF